MKKGGCLAADLFAALEPRLLLSADLVVDGGEAWWPETLLAGSRGQASVYVCNQGDTRLSGSVTVQCYASIDDQLDAGDLLLGSVTRRMSLASEGGASANLRLTMPASASPGDYNLLYVVNPSGALGESDAANNVAVGEIVAVAEPTVDLTGEFEGLELPETLLPGAKGKAQISVQNYGNVRANGTVTFRFYLSEDDVIDAGDLLIGSTAKKINLPPEGCTTIKTNLALPADTPAGTYQVLALADATGALALEIDPDNNVIYGDTVEVIEQTIDLTGELCDVGLGDEMILPGATGRTTVCVTNAGNVRANGNLAVQFYLSEDESFDAADVLVGAAAGKVNLTPDGWREMAGSVAVPRDTAAGSYYMLAVIDPANAFHDADVDNNVLVGYDMVEITEPTVDLMVGLDEVALEGEVMPGATGKATVCVGNYGNSRASGAVAVAFYASTDETYDAADVVLGSVAANVNLAPDNCREFTAYLQVPAGITPDGYYVLAVVTSAMNDIDILNNTAVSWSMFQVMEPQRDLVGYLGETDLPETVTPGSTGSVRVEVVNEGNVRAGGNVAIKVYASFDEQYDADDILLGSTTATVNLLGGDARGYNVALTFPADIGLTGYYLLAVIDANNAIAEVNEFNNVALSDYLVQVYETAEQEDSEDWDWEDSESEEA